MSSLSQLPEELTREVLEFILERDPLTLRSIMRVNKTLHDLALEFLDRDLTVDFNRLCVNHTDYFKGRRYQSWSPYYSDTGTEAGQLGRLQQLQQLQRVRSLRIIELFRDRSGAAASLRLLKQLEPVLPAMSGLQWIHMQCSSYDWDASMDSLNSTLDLATTAKIAVSVGVGLFDNSEEVLLRLLSMSALHRLEFILLPRNKSRHEPSSIADQPSRPLCYPQYLEAILLSCPNLKHLSTDSYIQSSFSNLDHDGLPLRGRGRKVLNPDGSVWTVVEDACTPQIEELIYLGPADHSYDRLDWVETANWGRLHRLDTGDAKLLEALAGRTPALKSLKMCWNNALCEFLEVSPKLETIHLLRVGRYQSFSFCVDNIRRLAIHGEKLRELHIHDAVGTVYGYLRDTSLAVLQQHCPLIEDLALPLKRGETDWPWAEFDALAAFTKLRRLEFWFACDESYIDMVEYGLWSPGGVRLAKMAVERWRTLQPAVSFYGVSEMFEYLHEKRPSLVQLRVFSCHKAPELSGLNYPKPLNPSPESLSFTAELVHGFGTSSEFKITCPGLVERLNSLRNGRNWDLPTVSKTPDDRSYADRAYDSYKALRAEAYGHPVPESWDGARIDRETLWRHCPELRTWRERSSLRESFEDKMRDAGALRGQDTPDARKETLASTVAGDEGPCFCRSKIATP